MSGTCPGNVRKNVREMSGRNLGEIWAKYLANPGHISGPPPSKCPGNVREMSGKCLGNVQETSWRHLLPKKRVFLWAKGKFCDFNIGEHLLLNPPGTGPRKSEGSPKEIWGHFLFFGSILGALLYSRGGLSWDPYFHQNYTKEVLLFGKKFFTLEKFFSLGGSSSCFK